MAEMPYLTAISGASSVLSLPTLILPANWSAILSIVGASIRHGPHHTAQKSTRTGFSLLVTSFSQFAAVNSITLALAMPCRLSAKVSPPGRLGRPEGPVYEHYRRTSQR